MPSKLEALREGRAVEVEPGVYGKLNPQTKSLEMSTGEILKLGDNPAYFPQNEQQKTYNKEREQIKKEINKFPLGKTAGEFAYQFGQSSSLSGVKDWVNYLTKTGDDYVARKRAEQDVSSRISEESPFMSGAATVASFVPDIALTRGMNAVTAGPALVGLKAGPRIIEEPGEVAGEAAIAGAAGKLLDIGGAYLSKAAGRRGAARKVAQEAENVRLSNIAGEQEAQAALQNEMKWASRENTARQHQYNLELNARHNNMVSAEKAYQEALSSHNANTAALKEQAKVAQKSYEEAVKKMPQLQAQAQREFSQNLDSAFKEIEGAFPKGTKIPTNDLDVWGFYNNYIQQNGLVGTAEARANQQLFRSLFPNGRNLSPKEFADRLRAVEASIGKSSPESQKLLTAFKEHLGAKAPPILGDAIIARETMPAIRKAISQEVSSIMKSNPLQGVNISSAAVEKEVQSALRTYVDGMNPKELARKVKSGEFTADVRKLFPYEKYESMLGNSADIKKLKESGLFDYVKNQPQYQVIPQGYENLISNVVQRSENAIARSQLEGTKLAGIEKGKLTNKLKKTYGMAEPLPEPTAPQAPSFPEAPQRGMEPPMPTKPSMVENPTASQYTPQEIPTLAPAQGFAEASGDFLEQPISQMLFKNKGAVDDVARLAGLKYLAGAAKTPLVGGYAALKGLTSPTAGGEVARASFKNLGLGAIEQMAAKYPSYHDGILDDPRERRSLTKEIEDNQEIPPETKAILQSQINRGRPFMQRLQ